MKKRKLKKLLKEVHARICALVAEDELRDQYGEIEKAIGDAMATGTGVLKTEGGRAVHIPKARWNGLDYGTPETVTRSPGESGEVPVPTWEDGSPVHPDILAALKEPIPATVPTPAQTWHAHLVDQEREIGELKLRIQAHANTIGELEKHNQALADTGQQLEKRLAEQRQTIAELRWRNEELRRKLSAPMIMTPEGPRPLHEGTDEAKERGWAVGKDRKPEDWVEETR